MESTRKEVTTNGPERNPNTRVLICDASGLTGGALWRYFKDKGFANIRGVDKKPVSDWYQRVPGVECLSIDLSQE